MVSRHSEEDSDPEHSSSSEHDHDDADQEDSDSELVDAPASPDGDISLDDTPESHRTVSEQPSLRSTTSSGSENAHSDQHSDQADDTDLPDIRPAVQFSIQVPPVSHSSEYEEVELSDTVDHILEEYLGRGNSLWYKIQFGDGRIDNIPASNLNNFENGVYALSLFNANYGNMSDDSEPAAVSRHTRSMSRKTGRSTTANSQTDSEDELSVSRPQKKRRLTRSTTTNNDTSRRTRGASGLAQLTDESDSEPASRPKKSRATRMSSRETSKPNYNYGPIDGADADDGSSGDEDEFEPIVSDLAKPQPGRRGRPPVNAAPRGRGRPRKPSVSSSEDELREASRRSGRNNKAAKSMREVGEDEEIYADDVEAKGPKVINIREVFQPISPKAPFRIVHSKMCDVCKNPGGNSLRGSNNPLIHCQGCTISIHKLCLGYRSSREHVVTKIGEDDFVFQCRRCVGLSKKKDPTAARLDICQVCKIPGASCAPFSQKKTPKQEEKLRSDNGGIDPITEVSEDLINNPDNVLFRCIDCQRGFHFEHLPPLADGTRFSTDDETYRQERIEEYAEDFHCKDCCEVPGKVKGMVAWRPVDIDSFDPHSTVNDLEPEQKEYLVRWEDFSYFHCTWMPGAWVWGALTPAMRTAFARRDENQSPKMTAEDAIPEEYLRMEIIMDVRYTSNVKTHTEKVDMARVTEVDQVLVKFQGLGYEEVVWERPPDSTDTERWDDFVAAYNEFLAGKYFKQPAPGMQKRIKDYRELDFKKHVLLKEQPSSLTGGKLMDYQMEGVNWLLFNYHQEKSVILADEMGLGKTLQIIAMIATLVKDKPKTWPFLVVVPNSTCPNWRREIKTWAPSLRVVAYYGSKAARDLAMEYELYPGKCKDLRAHIVVTSYEAPVDESCRLFFRRVKWSGVIVDEGQRLKSDQNLLYKALQAINAPFKVLLTGTPLQNNKRELFNLLQFIDNSIDAEALDEEYAELNNENIPRLHEKIKPYFLRRTKATALTFLPPMAQVIVPVTMTVVQKSLYKSILSRNSDLIKSIFAVTKTAMKPGERTNLNNILMQLRKVLCHPFMFSQAVEERALPESALHRNLVQASAKLQLLDIMLPKLQERGHRVLLFSQFLDQLDIIEDFLVGLGMQFERLDGKIGALEKQKRIDAFNAPNSPLFAFLLSTRAGGVGINLATADTVIILDPDFNPHQDLQALSRAHRIGQKKKVLVFQLMTKESAEEKIVQIGRKKMALDHVLIESLDQEEDAGLDLESILKHGARALFEDNDEHDIHYNSESVDKLLDRTHIENTNTGADGAAENAFSFARVWANDAGALTDDFGVADEPDSEGNLDVWDKLLEERAAEAAREAELRKEALGKGKRVRKAVNYKSTGNHAGLPDDDIDDLHPRRNRDDKSDTDFAEEQADSDADDDDDEDEHADIRLDASELETRDKPRANRIAPTGMPQAGQFHRARIAPPLPTGPGPNDYEAMVVSRALPGYSADYPIPRPFGGSGNGGQTGNMAGPFIPPAPIRFAKTCVACGQVHPPGYCSLKRSGIENCGLCGIAHFAGGRYCPHLQSETQVKSMLRALKYSTESQDEIRAAKKYLQSVMGNLVNRKKKIAQQQAQQAMANGQPQAENRPRPAPQNVPHPHSQHPHPQHAQPQHAQPQNHFLQQQNQPYLVQRPPPHQFQSAPTHPPPNNGISTHNKANAGANLGLDRTE